MKYFLNKISKFYRTLPLFGPKRFQFEVDRSYIYSKVFYSRTSKFHFSIRVILYLISPITWYYKSLVLVIRSIRRNGTALKEKAGISISKQLSSLLSLVFFKNTPPFYYYYLKLYQNTFSIGKDFFINRHITPIYSGILCSEASRHLLSNKIAFKNRFSHLINEIPSIELIISLSNISDLFSLSKQHQSDLFIKPAAGMAGRDCYLLKKSDDSFLLITASLKLEGQNNIELFIEEIIKKETYIAQRRLTNHSQIYHITNENLASCRINTFKKKNGKISVHFAIFKMPVGKSIISNLSGSIISPVNIENGEIGEAISIRKPFELIEFHPEGKGKIPGTRLPYWNAAKETCLKAHQSFLDTAFIGWDVAFTQNGIKLLEGNTGWGVEEWQLSHRERFNSDEFISILRSCNNITWLFEDIV